MSSTREYEGRLRFGQKDFHGGPLKDCLSSLTSDNTEPLFGAFCNLSPSTAFIQGHINLDKIHFPRTRSQEKMVSCISQDIIHWTSIL